METEKNFYSPEEVAEILGVCYRTVLNRIKDGSLSAFKVGNTKSYRISHQAIIEFQGRNVYLPIESVYTDENKAFFDDLPERYSMTLDDIKGVNVDLELHGLQDLTTDKYFKALMNMYKVGFMRGKSYQHNIDTIKAQEQNITAADIF